MSLLAEILYNDKQYQKVSSILEKIIRIAPWKTDSKLFLCDVYQKLNQHKKAIKLADEMINGDSENSHEYQFKKAKSLYELGDYQGCFYS